MILLIVCVACLLIGPVGDGWEQSFSLVSVRVGREDSEAWAASGSGVVWQADAHTLWIVTAGHVLSRAGGENRVFVEFGADAVVECTAYETAGEVDLAFLRIDRAADLRQIKPVPPATDKESYDGLQASDAVWAEGSREGRPVRYDGTLVEPWIYVEDFAQYMMVAECGVEPGMSGGGLYDGAGHLIGIVCGGSGEGELAAVPLHVVQACFAAVDPDGA
ncbi:MAG: serine protease [Muribaculum sp.]|nr:serine protease [Muribaculum sp.]